MREVFYLTGLEYKKIWKKKMTWISVISLFLLIAIVTVADTIGTPYYNGTPIGSKMEWLTKEKQRTQEMAGVIDEAFLEKAGQTLEAFWDEVALAGGADTKADVAWFVENYEKSELPYNSLLMSGILADIREIGAFGNYYEAYDNYLRGYYSGTLSEADLEVLIAMSRENQPFYYGWQRGYIRYIVTRYSMSLFHCFAVVICLAGIFAGEVTTRMDALLLASRYGKNKLLLAKLLAGMWFSFVLAVFANLLSFLPIGLIYGFEGSDGAAQMYLPFIGQNVSLGQLSFILTGAGILAAMLTAALTVCVSAKSKNNSSVLIIMLVILMFPMFVNVPRQYQAAAFLNDLHPINMTAETSAFNEFLFRAGDGFIAQWQYAYPIYGVAVILLLAAAYRIFKKHQVGK